MFTWNLQYISKNRLAEAFDQLMLNPRNGDILIRIHTAIHLENEAVELAKFIVSIVPGAHIFGTSTSAVKRRKTCSESVHHLSYSDVKRQYQN